MVEAEAEGRANAFSRIDNSGCQGCGTDERQRRVFALGAQRLAVPLLALLAGVDRVEQVRAWLGDLGCGERAEVGDRDILDWWRLQEQVADRRVRRACERFDLLQRRQHRALLPRRQLGQAAGQGRLRDPGPLPGPSEQLRFDAHAHGQMVSQGQCPESTKPLRRSRIVGTSMVARKFPRESRVYVVEGARPGPAGRVPGSVRSGP